MKNKRFIKTIFCFSLIVLGLLIGGVTSPPKVRAAACDPFCDAIILDCANKGGVFDTVANICKFPASCGNAVACTKAKTDCQNDQNGNFDPLTGNCLPKATGAGNDDFAGFGNVSKNDCNENTNAGETLNKGNCHIVNDLIIIINVLSALAAVIIVASIVAAGIQYSSSSDDPGKVQAAKQRIFNALLALFALLFFFAFLQYLVPGGVL